VRNPARVVRPAGCPDVRPVIREVAMATVTRTETRDDIRQAMSRMTDTTAVMHRRGHDGRHKSCDECIDYVEIHHYLDELLTKYETAER
jgi:hypothetical protein